ncbi:MAG: carbohydrate ABC transporter permease [Butyrivibrio sp.]|nr:carbohydrate ABC transporter permease [Butyrivibrio sp.]
MKNSLSRNIFVVCNTIILLLIGFCSVAPIWHVFCASVSDPSQLLAYNGLLLKPLGNINFEGYRMALKNGSILKGYINTLIYVTASTTLGLAGSIVTAYALSRKDFMWKSQVTFLLAFTMLFNGGLIPTYLLVRNLKLLNTVWAIILPNCLSVYNIMILKTSFSSLPDGLVDAARIDGAGHFKTITSVVVPCSKGILSVIGLFYVVQNWNSWFHTAIYVTERKLYPLQLLLREIVIMNSKSGLELAGENGELSLSRELVKYAVIVISILPMMIVYPFIQRYFVSGVMLGSIKE